MVNSRFSKFDIGGGNRPQPPGLFRSRKEEYEKLIGFTQKAVPAITKKSRYAIMPFVVTAVLIAMMFQSLVYVSKARNAQGQILGAATSAYSDLSNAGASLKDQNFSNAQSQFSSAYDSLQNAQSQLDQFQALQLLAPQAQAAGHVLSGASLLAAAGAKLTFAMSFFDDVKISSKGIAETGLTKKLKANQDSLNSTLFLLKQAQSEFDRVKGLPASYADTLTKARQQVDALTNMLTNMVNLEDIYLGMFGNGPKTYLFVFQNYDEVRATGGFMGTYGVLKIDGGKIQSMKIDSIYDLDGHIYDKIAAPGPFQPDIQKWGIRDSNWFADFPTSAKKILHFYELGAETADGVIAMSPNFFENVLTLTGPIQMPDYGVTLTSDNFQDIVQFKTSADYDKKLNQPKKFLADLAPVILDKLAGLDKEKMLQLLQMFQTNLNQKQILLYSTDQNLQQKIQGLKFSGEILPSDQDYLDIVNTNLGGTKTDLKVKQNASLNISLGRDGRITDTLTISRTNTASEINKDYIRILVPAGSNLISSDGFDAGTFEASQSPGYKPDPDLLAWDQGVMGGNRVFVRTESGKTEFAGWTIANPGETKTLTLVYTIPYKLNLGLLNPTASYSLLFQKQDGIKPYQFAASVDTGSLRPIWYTSGVGSDSGRLNFAYDTGSDQYWAVLLSK